jgi:hypothetical protein
LIHEIAWLAKGIRAANQLNIEGKRSQIKSDDTWERFARIAFNDVYEIRERMNDESRIYFRASEWTEAKHRRKARPNVNFASDLVHWLDAFATTAERKDSLRWFRSTIALTKAHRKQNKKDYALKAAALRPPETTTQDEEVMKSMDACQLAVH